MAPAGALEQDPNSKYELRHQIGRGSFGSAFLVTNKQDKADYVLKRVRLAKQTKWQRNSTLQERDLATSLRHPFIVPCVESWVVQNHTVNMIYAFCQNGDLSSYLAKVKKQEGQVEEGLMQKWLCQLLLALDYLQTQQVLHRDIKTSNLMLTCDNDVQLGDFGLATLMEEDGDKHKPQDTNLVGTPHNMSPEMLSCKAYGFKTDVWSLGCVFYELTAQRPTFNAFNIHGLVSKIKKNKLAPLPTNYSEDWRDVIALMLCKNPEKRPSVQQLMGLPALHPAMLEARARARELMPLVQLPPLLDPTPLTPQPLLGQYRSSCSQDVADAESEGSAGNSTSNQQAGVRSCGGNSDAGSSKLSSRADRCSAAGLTAAHAVQASELSELWKANFGQLQQAEEQLDTARPEQQSAADAQLAAVAQQQVQQCAPPCRAQGSRRATGTGLGGSEAGSRSACSTSAGGCSPADSSSSALTPIQGAAGECRGLGVGYSPRNGLGVIDGYRRIVTPSKPGHVNQPGIKRTPSERVAAAIAAAEGSPAQAAAAAAAANATGRVTPDLCPRPRLDSGPSLARTSRSSSSSQRAASGALTPQQQQQPGPATETPTGQSTPTDSSATPRVPSNVAKRQASITSRQDSARRHRASDCTHVHGSGAHTARPGTAPQADQQLEGTAAAPTPTKAAGTPTRPLSAPRCSSVRRGSDRGPSSNGGSKQQQRPPWGAGAVGGRSCLTPGRQRPEQSPILKAVKATNAASGAAVATAAGAVAGAAGAAVLPADAGILADAASAHTARKQRRSHGQLGPVPSEKVSARGAESPATGMECQAECGAPVVHHHQQQQQVPRRSSSSAGAAESPAHGLSRSSSHHSADDSPQQHQEQQQQQQQQQQDQRVSGASPLHDLLPSRHPRYSAGGTALPPLPLHKLQFSSSKDGTQAPALSPIPLASPVHGQDRPAPVARTSSGSASKQPQTEAPGSPFSQHAAAAAQPPSDSGSTKQQSVSSTRVLDRGASNAQQSEQGVASAIRSSTSGGGTVSNSGSRRVSGSASTSRRSSGGAAGLPLPGNLRSRRSNSQDAEQQPQQQQPRPQQPMSVRTPAADSSEMVSRRSSGNSMPKRGQQPPQQQQEQPQLVVEDSPQPQQPPYEEVMQRLELLESAMMVIGGLAARGRWTELSSVMHSEGLLPDGMMKAMEAGQQQQSSVLKLGDIVVLGKKRDIKGKIRYIGPVVWDPTAADWVGMELDQPRGVDATQRGITYFACPPSCASFHKASDLTTLGA